MLGRDVSAWQLRAKDLTAIQTGYAHYANVGDVVVPVWDRKKLDLERGVQYTVVDKQGDLLSLLGPDGRLRQVEASSFRKTIYERIVMPVAVGERTALDEERTGNGSAQRAAAVGGGD